MDIVHGKHVAPCGATVRRPGETPNENGGYCRFNDKVLADEAERGAGSSFKLGRAARYGPVQRGWGRVIR